MNNNNQKISGLMAIIIILIVGTILLLSQKTSPGGEKGTVAPLITAPAEQHNTLNNPDIAG